MSAVCDAVVGGECQLEHLTHITVDLKMYLGAKQVRDRIQIEGLPSIDLEIHGGTCGDPATAGIVVNAAPLVVAAAPSLATMASLPPVHYWRG